MGLSPVQNGQAYPCTTCLTRRALDESATWVVAEGADAAGMNRSVPLSLATSDALLALYQMVNH